MEPNKYDVLNTKNDMIVSFGLLKEAELWVAGMDNPDDFEIIPVQGDDCFAPMNLFLDSSNLTRNKR